MPCVVKHIRSFAATYTGHHVGHHGTQASPWHYGASVDFGEALVDPIDQWFDAV
jgi:hypothetical protein